MLMLQAVEFCNNPLLEAPTFFSLYYYFQFKIKLLFLTVDDRNKAMYTKNQTINKKEREEDG